MRIIVVAALALLMIVQAAPAWAQQQKRGAPKPPSPQEIARKKEAERADEAYQKSLKQIPANQKPVDPWGNMR